MTVTLNGQVVTRGRLVFPEWGVAWGDLELAEPDVLTGRVVLTDGVTSVSCTIISGGVDAGRAAYRVAVGAGGWGRALPQRGYQNDAGVKKSLVLGDAASECGETLADVPSGTVGNHFARANAPASEVLQTLARNAWRVDDDGVTRFGLRPDTTYTGEGTADVGNSHLQTVDVKVDDITGLRPGVLVAGVRAADVEYSITSSKITATVYPRGGVASTDLVGQIIQRLLPTLRYQGVSEYRVVNSNTDYTVDVQPVLTSIGLPELRRVPVRGVPGLRAKFNPGAVVLIAFVNGNPARPEVVAGDAMSAPGWASQSGQDIEIGAVGESDDYVALAALVNRGFDFYETLFTNWVVAPSDGGLALKTAFGLAIANPLTAPVDVSAANTKAT
jgi:hypothetical protein